MNMPVLVEAISVIIKVEAIQSKFPGGWNGFENVVPNQTLCSDGEIARVGFMDPADAESFIEELTTSDLTFLLDGRFVDIAVVDQLQGPTAVCDWVEVGKVCLEGDSSRQITAARLSRSQLTEFATPDYWQYGGSLSHTFCFSPTDANKTGLKFLRSENGLEVYLNELTGKEVYFGRTS